MPEYAKKERAAQSSSKNGYISNRPAKSAPTCPFSCFVSETGKALGHDFSKIRVMDASRKKMLTASEPGSWPVQAKLTINQPGDKYEQEADRIAEQVMRMPESKIVDRSEMATPLLMQRSCPKCKKNANERQDEKERLQLMPVFGARLGRSGAQATSLSVPPIVHEVLRTPGQPLDGATRAFMEPRFGADFSKVRLHTGRDVVKLNRAVNAQAFTHGAHIYLGEGKNNLESSAGKHLLAHELTHTIQQGAAWLLTPSVQQARFSQVDVGLIQRQGDDVTSVDASNAPTLDQLYNIAVQNARQTGNWQDAAEKLNGFNYGDIQIRLAQLTPNEVGYIHQGALENPRVGPQSQLAQLTDPGSPPVSSNPAGVGSRKGRYAVDEDQDGNPRAEERAKAMKRKEIAKERQKKPKRGLDEVLCKDIERPTFDSINDLLTDVRRRLKLPNAVEGNARDATGNDASNAYKHYTIYENESMRNTKGFVGTFFSQWCLDDNKMKVLRYTTEFDRKSGAGQSTNSDNLQPKIIGIHPAFRNIYGFIPSALVPRDRLFIIATPVELIDAYFGAMKMASDLARLQVRTPAVLGQRALAAVTTATLMATGLVIGIAVASGGGIAAAGGAAAATEATTVAAESTALPMVMTFLSQVAANDNAQAFAAAAGVAIYVALRGVLSEEDADERAKAVLEHALTNKQVLATKDVTASPSLANIGAQLTTGNGSYAVIAVLRT